MTRKWGATGVGRPVVHQLNKTTKQNIETEINCKGLQPKDGYNELFQALERAISQFKSYKKLAEETSRARVRENLKQTLKLALNLNKALNKLDGNSRQLINQYSESTALQQEHLASIIKALHHAKRDARFLNF